MNNNIIYLFYNLAQFIEQGINLQDIFTLLIPLDQNNYISDIQKNMSQGNTFDEAIAKLHLPPYFLEYYSFFKVNFSLSDSIYKTIDICKKRNEIKNNLIKKLSYPLLLIVFIIIFSIFIIIFLLPQVEQLFVEFNIEKSFFVSIIFILLRIIPILFTSCMIVFSLVLVFIIYSIKKQRFDYIDFLINHTFIFSKIIKKYYSVKFAIYYNELLSCHYDVYTIIDMLYHQINDSDIKMIVYELNQLVINGYDLYEVIEKFDYFEIEFKNFFGLVMNNNNINLNDYINNTIRYIEIKISKIIKILVPFVYSFVAIFVITIYISIILPMMNVVSAL